jgi:hypothetical protein
MTLPYDELNIKITEEVAVIIKTDKSEGPIGATGATGLTGASGIQGLRGDTGPRGIDGLSFMPDAIGTFSERYLYDGEYDHFTYLTTESGILYFKRSDLPSGWTDGTGFGIPGPQGIQGIQGIEGPTGASGIQGIQGIQGIEGPTGASGIQGIQGIQGPDGIVGPGLEGSVALPLGANIVTVDFGVTYPTDDYTVHVSLVNEVDGYPSSYAYTIIDRTTTGFTVDFSGAMDSENYILSYMVGSLAGLVGPQGEDGISNSKWWDGWGVPAVDLGNIQDYYLDSSTANVYANVSGTGWGVVANIRGIQGEQGEIGASDHGVLSGLADDDHTQYHTDARADGRYIYRANSTAFTPTADYHPATKKYVDDATTAVNTHITTGTTSVNTTASTITMVTENTNAFTIVKTSSENAFNFTQAYYFNVAGLAPVIYFKDTTSQAINNGPIIDLTARNYGNSDVTTVRITTDTLETVGNSMKSDFKIWTNNATTLKQRFELNNTSAIIGTSSDNLNLKVYGVIQPLYGSTTVNEFSIDGTLAGNSDDALPTEKAVKNYVDKYVDSIQYNPADAALGGCVIANTGDVVIRQNWTPVVKFTIDRKIEIGDAPVSDYSGNADLLCQKVGNVEIKLVSAGISYTPSILLAKGRGNLTTPTTNTLGDSLGHLYFAAYDTSGSNKQCDISYLYDQGLSFITGGSTATLTTKMILSQAGLLSLLYGAGINEFSTDGTLAGNADNAVPTEKAVKTYVGASVHTRSHTMSSTSDHTAGTWKSFYSDGSGNVAELALGTDGYYLQSTGTGSAPRWQLLTAYDHGTASTAQVVNVCYGTGAAPTASTTTEGSLYIKYTA